MQPVAVKKITQADDWQMSQFIKVGSLNTYLLLSSILACHQCHHIPAAIAAGDAPIPGLVTVDSRQTTESASEDQCVSEVSQFVKDHFRQ